MTTHSLKDKGTFLSPEDVQAAEETVRILATYLDGTETLHIQIVEGDKKQEVVLPGPAIRMIVEMLGYMARGNMVKVTPLHAQLTTQQAADFLCVSRPFLINLLESGEMPFHHVGTHRRVRFEDLVDYKERIDAERQKVLDDLTAEAQELRMGY